MNLKKLMPAMQGDGAAKGELCRGDQTIARGVSKTAGAAFRFPAKCHTAVHVWCRVNPGPSGMGSSLHMPTATTTMLHAACRYPRTKAAASCHTLVFKCNTCVASSSACTSSQPVYSATSLTSSTSTKAAIRHAHAAHTHNSQGIMPVD
jgi:hypothetical protein